MREFVFTIEYEPGVDPVMDVFIEHPNAHARSITCNVSAEGMSRLDRLAGPEDALEALDTIYADPVRCNECIGAGHCDTDWIYETLDSEPGRRTVYSYRPGSSDCHSVPRLATEFLGNGVLYEAERRERRYEWRLLLQDDIDVGDLYTALEAELREGISLSFRQLRPPAYWTNEAVTTAELPPEQQAAVETAVESGYYRTPRDISLTELSEKFGLSRSTLQYRLQRAEAWVVRCFVSRSMGPTVPDDAEDGQIHIERTTT